jgi:molybdate transport system substrate-binding protein
VTIRLAIALTVLVALGGCTNSPGAGDDPTTITVLAASSLTDVAKDITSAYQREHPDVRLRFSLAGSQELASQIRQGVPADVIVTADEPTMNGLGNLVHDPVVVAANRLTIVVEKGNPKRVDDLADLARPDVVTVLADATVPVGRYSRQVLDAAGVKVKAQSEEPDVRAVLTRVRLGEADAGIVYGTDIAAAADEVEAVSIPADVNLLAHYPAAVVADSQHPDDSKALVDWLTSTAGQRVMSRAGFLRP